MVRTLIGEGVPNIVQPSTEYPFGKFKDKTSASTNNGTELSERVLGDMYQGMLNTITRTGATPNNQPETALLSQFADAVELCKPVAIVTVGNDNGTTFKVLRSIVRDPALTFVTSQATYESDTDIFSAFFNIKRNGSVDATHKYIVVATPTCTLLQVRSTPKVFVRGGDFFDNTASTVGNLVFLYSEAVSPSTAVGLAQAVLVIYDAGEIV